VSGLDVVIIVVVLAAVSWGVRAGFVVQVGTYAGFLGGALLGAFVAGRLASWSSDPASATLLSLGAVAFFGVVLASVGGVLGALAQRGLVRIRLRAVDAALGGIVAAAGTLVTIWLLGASLATVPQSGIGAAIQESRVIRWLDHELPPVPDVAARLGRLTDPLGFPRVFAGLEPTPAAPVTGPLPAQVQGATRDAAGSTVRIRGVGCGGIVFGSGWVAATGVVVTNAHVVAGISDPVVQDTTGDHRAVAVVFDPDRDVAILRTSGLAEPPLAITGADPGRGAVGAVLGYPGGGPLTAGGAAVRDAYQALGRDIYGGGLTRRDILELQADVRPGSSGGPFVLPDGTVGGMVFARSVTTSGLGYALAPSELRRELSHIGPGSVSTGPCAAA
jgi:S1-C subfamily serine protease